MDSENIRLHISTNVISMEIDVGHLKWKVADLSRACNVGRTLIYYYLGKDKTTILRNAVQIVCEDFYALTGKRKNFIKEGKLFESIMMARSTIRGCPQIAMFYQKWRFDKTEISNQLEILEKKYREKLTHCFPHLSQTQITSLHGFIHGMVTAPFHTEAEIKNSVQSLVKDFRLGPPV